MKKRLTRQSFLGRGSGQVLAAARAGLVGLGGGGSHIAQQTAHVGFGRYVLTDPQDVELSNTNRLVGATLADARQKTAKVAVAKRLILGLEPSAEVKPLRQKWQDCVDDLRECDVIFGAVDGLKCRDELERFCRSHLIPYIDIGMTVTKVPGHGFLISGQVIQSLPGQPCMHCAQFITAEKLDQETRKYGDAGANPQVIWPNGVLASTAVGLAVRLLSPWAQGEEFIYLSYDGNSGTMQQSGIAQLVRDQPCPHHPPTEVGDPLFALGR